MNIQRDVLKFVLNLINISEIKESVTNYFDLFFEKVTTSTLLIE